MDLMDHLERMEPQADNTPGASKGCEPADKLLLLLGDECPSEQ